MHTCMQMFSRVEYKTWLYGKRLGQESGDVAPSHSVNSTLEAFSIYHPVIEP